jgi:hypothetical protein
MLMRIVHQVAALAERGKVRIIVVGGIVIEMRDRNYAADHIA